MSRYIFDIETNGLLDTVTTIHSLVLLDIDTDEIISCANVGGNKAPDGYHGLDVGFALMRKATLLVGHNVIKFDVPVLRKLYSFSVDPHVVEDTLVLSRLLYTDTKDWDSKLKATGKLPGRLWGSHGLEAWGYRLGEAKGDYAKECKEAGIDPWAAWSPEMQTYCEQDVRTNLKLYQKLVGKIRAIETPVGDATENIQRAVKLEHDVAWLCATMERNGFHFNVAKASELYAKLSGRRQELLDKLQDVFPPWWASAGQVTVASTRNVKREDLGTVTIPRISEKTGKPLKPYVGPVLEHQEEGAEFTRLVYTEFNPSSRQHIANRLAAYHGWQPMEYTPNGEPKVDDAVLARLPYPEAQLLAEYFTIVKRIGQLAEGPQAWLKVEKNGRIHGSVNTNGAVTGRATHSHPNMAQVPSVRAYIGKECRDLFTPTPGWKLLGSDMDALELRCLAGYMSLWDKGAYIDVVLKGDKAKGTDLHSVNCRALGMDPKAEYPVEGKMIPGRDIAKTWFYAFIYGAGNMKLGMILGKKGNGPCASAGKKSRQRFLSNLPALGALTKAVQETAKQRGYLIGLDGRRLYVRSEHAALNTLLQAAGAVLCKKWIVLIDEKLRQFGLKHGTAHTCEYAFNAWVHDEVQISVRPEFAIDVGVVCEEAAIEAGQYFNFSCPTAADYTIGSTWAETH